MPSEYKRQRIKVDCSCEGSAVCLQRLSQSDGLIARLRVLRMSHTAPSPGGTISRGLTIDKLIIYALDVTPSSFNYLTLGKYISDQICEDSED